MTEGQLKATLLGTCTPSPRIDRFGISTLIEAGDQKLIIDCGREAIQRLEQLDISFNDVDKLFLTHLHSDHIVGNPDLLLTGWIFGRHVPFRVWGPDGTRNLMSHLVEAFEFDIHIRRDVDEMLPAEGVRVEVVEVEEDFSYEGNGLKLTVFKVDHQPVEPAFRVRIEYQGKVVVLSGDTRPSENLIKFARGADLLIHEVAAPREFVQRTKGRLPPEMQQKVIAHHTTPQQAGAIFSRVRPKLAVYSHFSAGEAGIEEILVDTKKTYDGAFEVGYDLMAIEVGDEIKVVPSPALER